VSELDLELIRLGSLPPPAALDGIDDAVIAGFLAQRKEASFGKRATALARHRRGPRPDRGGRAAAL